MRELTCIVCPVGCFLTVEAGAGPGSAITVTGNRCPRGAEYAREELSAPRRMVTATVAIAESGDAPRRSLSAPRRIPVKTSAPCPKEKIGELLRDIYRLRRALPVKAGETLISNWNGSGIDVVAVRTLG